jgi:hypothetical protein
LNAPRRGSSGRRLFDFDDCFICHTYPCCLTYQRVDASRPCTGVEQLSCQTFEISNPLFLNTIFSFRILRWGVSASDEFTLKEQIPDKTGLWAPGVKKPRWGAFAPA